jgi:hypothetical protein
LKANEYFFTIGKSGMTLQDKSKAVSDDIRARQRSTVWPDTLRNGRVVDSFIWKGSPDATLVQRIGIALFGFLFLCPALLLVRFGVLEPGPVLFRTLMLLFALPWLAIGCKVAW